ncbi:MAG TPA: DNA polymerase/3'-5' exonuclease PolX [Solirubrobacteraceae bacterium]|nr:DNA polymerase/3'-5' exonuclease PolX [Solirubrobacteraceae bacterium]
MAAELPNSTIAEALEELGDLYELDGAIVHRVLAYRNAARAVREAPVSVAVLARAGRVSELSGIGATLEQKILALLDTGTIPAAEKLRAKVPTGLIAITRLPGLGPKRARLLHAQLGIDSLDSLREAALAGKLQGVRGLGAKFEASVIEALERMPTDPVERSRRLLLPDALELGQTLAKGLAELGGEGTQVLIAGSARRMADSVKDVDLIAVTRKPVTLAKSLATLAEIESVSSAGKSGAKGRTHSGVSVDLRIAKPGQLGNLLQHFTGSGKHNAALREMAVRKGLHVSEYAIKDDATGATNAYASEREVYARLGLTYIEPELREDRGELAAAALAAAPERKRSASTEDPADSAPTGLPKLIELSDIKGDLHCHTVASDGRNTIEEMALAARDRGYEYVAITDHSASHGFGNDVSAEELRLQIEHIREVDASIEGIRVLAGSEVNILPDGSLDYEDELLGELDWVIASVHTAFGMNEQKMTERMVAAMEHPLVDAIGHPTGRMIERREPYALDMHAVIEAALRTGTMLEINANPRRRDLGDVHARAAARAGATVVIDSDAHGTERFEVMRWGVATARRAWLSTADVANTRSWEQLARLRKQSRQ